MPSPPPPLSSRLGAVRSSSTVLRIVWPRAPEAILRPLTSAEQAADLHASTADRNAARNTSLVAAGRDARIARLRRATAS